MPISRIDDLFDPLQGAVVFLKFEFSISFYNRKNKNFLCDLTDVIGY